MKNKTVLMVMILMFAVALGAGVVAGKLSSRLPDVSQPTDRGTLSDVLHLSTEQRAQMQTIWEGVRKSSDNYVDEAKTIQDDEDRRVKAMLSPEQFEQYSKLTMEVKGKIAELNQKREAAFHKGVGDSLKLMNPAQQQLYKQIVEDHVGQLPQGGAEAGAS